jgi:hypothetical protein
VTDQQAHNVSVTLNGNFLGNMTFADQSTYKQSFPVNPSTLQEGANTVTLTALDGENDVSLVQTIVLHCARSFVAENNSLWLQAAVGSEIHATGFLNSRIRVFDITNPQAVEELQATIHSDSSSFAADFGVPGSANSSPARNLLVIADDQVESPSALTFHSRGILANHQASAAIVMITHPDFVPSLTPLVQMREQQGYSVRVVTTDEIFDAFNFGERSPYALREFLRQTTSSRQTRPQFVLLVGDASLDPRNYLGFGNFDFVPTRLIDTQQLKTASDDWFTDFNQTGFASIATGRLPVRTPADADLVISKIINYESGRNTGSWNSQALVIADQDLGANFSATTNSVSKALTQLLSVNKLITGNSDPQTVKEQIIAGINAGQSIVNFTGHGSVEQWSFSDLLDNNDAAALQNGGKLPVFFIMNCLNGFFQDVYTQSLAESLLLAPNGGAVAVWASSGFTDAPPQASQDIS